MKTEHIFHGTEYVVHPNRNKCVIVTIASATDPTMAVFIRKYKVCAKKHKIQWIIMHKYQPHTGKLRHRTSGWLNSEKTLAKEHAAPSKSVKSHWWKLQATMMLNPNKLHI
ncbi:uncharacterized protein LOC134226974 [Armigeres subalbatus]|uniref:uncharacterized protein LOC134226974 n=1 Tax=Armigeres subalbatus TaxID=124917 RepID=UPI002ED22A23